MANVHDVAAYVLQETGPISTWKLQKLVYYSKAWSIVWEDDRLFDEQIQAWANGPVVPALYANHRGQFEVTSWQWGDPENLTSAQKETVDCVLGFYGDKTGHWLSELTHSERPWKEARAGLEPNERGQVEIHEGMLSEYYGSLNID